MRRSQSRGLNSSTPRLAICTRESRLGLTTRRCWFAAVRCGCTLGLVYLAKYQTPCSRDALNQYIEILEGQALYQSETRPVFTRIARVSPDCIYVDLGTPDHRAVEIAPDGWLIVDNPPVRFRRPKGFGALDIPVMTNKSLEESLGPVHQRADSG